MFLFLHWKLPSDCSTPFLNIAADFPLTLTFQLSNYVFICVTGWPLGIASNYINPSSLFPFSLQEKLFQWILRQQEEGSRVTTADIVTYLQVSFLWFLALIVLMNLFGELLFLILVPFSTQFYILYFELNASTNGTFLLHSGEFNWSVPDS